MSNEYANNEDLSAGSLEKEESYTMVDAALLYGSNGFSIFNYLMEWEKAGSWNKMGNRRFRIEQIPKHQMVIVHLADGEHSCHVTFSYQQLLQGYHHTMRDMLLSAESSLNWKIHGVRSPVRSRQTPQKDRPLGYEDMLEEDDRRTFESTVLGRGRCGCCSTERVNPDISAFCLDCHSHLGPDYLKPWERTYRSMNGRTKSCPNHKV